MVAAEYRDRRLPYDHSAEASVLGSLLIDGEALPRAVAILSPHDFHRARHQFCFEACVAVWKKGEAVDQITVARELQRQERLDQIGGLPYLGQLIADTPTSVNMEHYAAIVADTAAKRRIVDAGNRIAELGFDNGDDAAVSLNRAVDVLFSIQAGQANRGFVPLATALERYLQGDSGESSAEIGQLRYTGFNEIDRVLGGLRNSDLMIVGARPGMGKSSLALNVCVNLARDGATCAIFSLEMSLEQVAARILGSEAEIPVNRLTQGLFSEAGEDRMVDAVGSLSGLPIYVDDTALQTVTQMRSKAQRLQMEHGLDFLVIDYLQLIQGNGGRGSDNRVQEITEISRSLKALARDLNVPVLACSQLSRAVENRQNHRPQLSDLRDSGSIEQDADVVAFIYREDKHMTEDEWYQQRPSEPYPKGLVELIVAKHRHGPTGEAQLYFRENLMLFENLRYHQMQVA